MSNRILPVLLAPVFFALLTVGLVGCDSTEPVDDFDPATAGVYVANQGSFSDANGSVTWYDPETDQAQEFVSSVGSTVQSIFLHDDRLYVLANSGNRIEAVDFSGEMTVTIPVLSPRYMVRVTDSTAFVTSLFGSAGSFTGGKVFEVDLTRNQVTDSVAVGDNPEGIAVVDTLAFVANNAFGAGSSVTVIDTRSKQVVPWSMDRIGATESWTRSGDGRGSVDIDIYVLDTGARHGDLNVTECFKVTSSGRRDCGLLGRLDLNAHGTEVAGIAAASDNRAGIVGVAPGARVHAVKVLDDGGETELSSVIAVVDYLTALKQADPSRPMVVNMSLGANVRTAEYNALDRAVATSIRSGITYVIAAGNESTDAGNITPAHVREAITVGAYGAKNQHAWFSNYGAVVDLLAPGEDVETLGAGDGITRVSGTSIAAPHVTGAVALMLARRPTLSPQDVERGLIANGRAFVKGVPRGTTNRSVYVR